MDLSGCTRSTASWILPSSRSRNFRAGGLPCSRSSDSAALCYSRSGHVVCVSFFGSKRSPFFQTANVMAEIFRASVIVASSDFSPRLTKSW
jgi:hypothetical protein